MIAARPPWLVIAIAAVVLGCAGRRPPRAGPADAPLPAGAVELGAAWARVRAITAAAPRPGDRIRDAALEAWLDAMIEEVRRVDPRARLPFEPGEPRRPVTATHSTYTGKDGELIDGDLATPSILLGSVKRALVLVDGDANLGFIRDSIVVVTGRLHAAFIDDSVVIAGAGIEVSHGCRTFGERRGGGIPCVLLSGTTVRGGAFGAILGAPDGSDVHLEAGSTFISSPAMERVAGAATKRARLVLARLTTSTLEAGLEAAVGPGPIPRVCVYRRGEPAAISCAAERGLLGGALDGWRLAFSSSRLVVLARGSERIRLAPDRPALADQPATLAVPRGAEVHLIGAYAPVLPRGRVTVEVERRGAPIVLVLMSHESIDWQVRVARGVEIAGVVLAGWEQSWVSGVAAPIATRLHVFGEPAFYAYAEGGDGWSDVGSGLADVLGRTVQHTSFQGSERAPERFVIPDRPAVPVEMIQN
jgi:hypothetical protein